DGGSEITGYTVTVTPGDAELPAATNSLEVTSLTNGTTYTFTVHATNANGDGPESAPVSVTPLVSGDPDPLPGDEFLLEVQTEDGTGVIDLTGYANPGNTGPRVDEIEMT